MAAFNKPNKVGIALTAVGIGTLGVFLYLNSLTKTLWQDVSDVFRLVKHKKNFDRLMEGEYSVGEMFEETVSQHGDKVCLHYLSEDGSAARKYTFTEVNERANQVANWAVARGIKQGEVVGLMMENRPEYVWTWLGLAKVGAVIALINSHLRGHPLVHSLKISEGNLFIIGAELAAVAARVRNDVEKAGGRTYDWFVSGQSSVAGFEDLERALRLQPVVAGDAVFQQRRGLTLHSTLFYIYTSGTTGPPKASIVKHFKFYGAGLLFGEAFDFNSDDNVYVTLPLYHASGGMIGVGLAFAHGATMVFRKKFSSSRFWQDVKDADVTALMYIGELCRYLVTSPPGPLDRAHKVRIAVGNGLRPDVWEKFTERFGIERIGEFYAATEGNANMINTRNKFGAVGYISPLIRWAYPIKLVKFDVDAEEPIRDSRGFCIECAPGETGELLGKIEVDDPLRQFHGYTNKAATKKKVMRDVFEKEDMWFRTGDLLKRDADGFYYFMDRIGDTFRWKGENVATSEVGEVLAHIPGVKEANVYGVKVPHHDGRAGMAALVLEKDLFDLDVFYQRLAELPSYARPLFLRIRPDIETTGTFKHKKRPLVQQGFDPSQISDPLYFRDDSAKRFVPLTHDLFKQISSNARSKL